MKYEILDFVDELIVIEEDDDGALNSQNLNTSQNKTIDDIGSRKSTSSQVQHNIEENNLPPASLLKGTLNHISTSRKSSSSSQLQLSTAFVSPPFNKTLHAYQEQPRESAASTSSLVSRNIDNNKNPQSRSETHDLQTAFQRIKMSQLTPDSPIRATLGLSSIHTPSPVLSATDDNLSLSDNINQKNNFDNLQSAQGHSKSQSVGYPYTSQYGTSRQSTAVPMPQKRSATSIQFSNETSKRKKLQNSGTSCASTFKNYPTVQDIPLNELDAKANLTPPVDRFSRKKSQTINSDTCAIKEAV